MNRTIHLMTAGFVAALTLVVAACGGDSNDNEPTAPPATRPAASPTSDTPGIGDRVTLRGTLTLDGAPLEADFLGARVIRDGLNGPCQATIPAVSGGRYEIKVSANSEVRGCGVDGAQVVLWAFANGRYVYTNEATPWPGSGKTAEFNGTLSSATPDGATKPVTAFKGRLYDQSGKQLPGGTVVEAYVGDTRCGVTSLRYGDVTEGYYSLAVSGPDSVAGCAAGATLTFRLDGKPATPTSVNDLKQHGQGSDLDLTLQ